MTNDGYINGNLLPINCCVQLQLNESQGLLSETTYDKYRVQTSLDKYFLFLQKVKHTNMAPN